MKKHWFYHLKGNRLHFRLAQLQLSGISVVAYKRKSQAIPALEIQSENRVKIPHPLPSKEKIGLVKSEFWVVFWQYSSNRKLLARALFVS